MHPIENGWKRKCAIVHCPQIFLCHLRFSAFLTLSRLNENHISPRLVHVDPYFVPCNRSLHVMNLSRDRLQNLGAHNYDTFSLLSRAQTHQM